MNPPRNRKGGAGNPPPTGARASALPDAERGTAISCATAREIGRWRVAAPVRLLGQVSAPRSIRPEIAPKGARFSALGSSTRPMGGVLAVPHELRRVAFSQSGASMATPGSVQPALTSSALGPLPVLAVSACGFVGERLETAGECAELGCAQHRRRDGGRGTRRHACAFRICVFGRFGVRPRGVANDGQTLCEVASVLRCKRAAVARPLALRP